MKNLSGFSFFLKTNNTYLAATDAKFIELNQYQPL